MNKYKYQLGVNVGLWTMLLLMCVLGSEATPPFVGETDSFLTAERRKHVFSSSQTVDPPSLKIWTLLRLRSTCVRLVMVQTFGKIEH